MVLTSLSEYWMNSVRRSEGKTGQENVYVKLKLKFSASHSLCPRMIHLYISSPGRPKRPQEWPTTSLNRLFCMTSHPDNLGKYLDLQSDTEHQLLHWHSLHTSVQTYTRICNVSWYIHGMSEPFPQVISVSTLQTIVLSLVELSQETSVVSYFLIGKLFISQPWPWPTARELGLLPPMHRRCHF